jgi:hypothetical protein
MMKNSTSNFNEVDKELILMAMELNLSPEEWTLETVYECILEFCSTGEPKYWKLHVLSHRMEPLTSFENN